MPSIALSSAKSSMSSSRSSTPTATIPSTPRRIQVQRDFAARARRTPSAGHTTKGPLKKTEPQPEVNVLLPLSPVGGSQLISGPIGNIAVIVAEEDLSSSEGKGSVSSSRRIKTGSSTSSRASANSFHARAELLAPPGPALFVPPNASHGANTERVSIAGHYKASEDQPVRVSLPVNTSFKPNISERTFSPTSVEDRDHQPSRNIFDASKPRAISFEPRSSRNLNPSASASLPSTWSSIAPPFPHTSSGVPASLALSLRELGQLSDEELPLPEPYNPAYPHPISAYASPGVNPASLAASGYDKVLAHMLLTDPDLVKGTILANAESDDVYPPALTLVITPGEGNGIPERLWSRFESFGAARLHLPFGIGGPDPTSKDSNRTSLYSRDDIPPRFATHSDRTRERGGEYSFSSTPAPESRIKYDEYPCTPNPHNQAASFDFSHHSTHIPASPVHDISPWYKTEICQIWEDTGLCKYGEACQYAHGLNELRRPTAHHQHQADFSYQRLAEDHHYRKSSLPSPQHSVPFFGPFPSSRRASAPPQRLPILHEHDDPMQWWRNDDHGIESNPHHPPVNTQRYSPPLPRSTNQDGRLPALADNIWSTSYGTSLTSAHVPRSHSMVPQHSSSSLSSTSQSSQLHASSHSQFSSFTNSSDRSDDTASAWSPTDTFRSAMIERDGREEIKGRYSREENVDNGDKWRGIGSTSLDFSTGKSIWC